MGNTGAQAGEDTGLDLVVGLGRTGVSLLRYLHGRGRRLRVADSREQPPGLEDLRTADVPAELRLGEMDAALLDGVSRVFVSPGVSLAEPLLVAARDAGLEIAGDVELFARNASAPVMAVTGSNGKSTVASLLALMAECSDFRVGAGGNLGTPALDLMTDPEPDLYVLELSSFQLESTSSLAPVSAAVLNVSADHMDRHGDMDSYAAAKGRIYRSCGTAVFNRDDPATVELAASSEKRCSFGLDEPPGDQDLGLRRKGGTEWIFRGPGALLAMDELQIPGRHNVANCMAALALGAAAGLDTDAMLAAARTFTGLPHRTQWVGESDGVVWLDDSKATNVAATTAAVVGLDAPLVLIAGGIAKDQDLSILAGALDGRLRGLILLGRDADRLQAALGGLAPVRRVDSMEEAVEAAASMAQRGDIVLLSPACSSQDMFVDFADRGRRFAGCVARRSR